TTVTVSGQSGSYNECREAELSAGNGAITGDPNASNGQTRGSEGDNNHYVDYMFNGVPTSGTYYMKVRYYSTGVATVGVQVNGGSTQTVNLANSGSWNIVWTEHSVPVNLISGNNTIRIMGIGGNSCRQDRVCISNNSNARMGISETFVTASPPGLQESDLNGLLITPNPNTGTFEVAFYLEEGKKATLSILDVKGISWSRQQISGKGNHREKVVLTENAIGTFIVLLRKDNGTETRRTIVIR
ncbi:MAG TPA: T9SS type A sorting domain-containing protein, partial [Dyadobacter sp.]|nr:T9SS type A sorting domain-containing protein [Dyadobacter sp.]